MFHREDRPAPFTTRSDAKGFYTLRGLPAGDVRVVVRGAGRVTVEGEVKVPPTGLALFDAKLIPGVRYTGRVVNLRDEAVAGARVTAKADGGRETPFFFVVPSESDAVVTDAAGAFVLDGLEPGRKYTVVVRHARYLTAELPGLDGEAGGGVSDIEVLLEDAAWVTGTVTDTAGKPVAGARIVAPNGNDGGWRELDLGGVTVRVYVGGDDDTVDEGPTKARTRRARPLRDRRAHAHRAGEPLLLRARAPGYFAGELKVDGLEAGKERAEVVFRLEPGTAVVAGVVVDDTRRRRWRAHGCRLPPPTPEPSARSRPTPRAASSSNASRRRRRCRCGCARRPMRAAARPTSPPTRRTRR